VISVFGENAKKVLCKIIFFWHVKFFPLSSLSIKWRFFHQTNFARLRKKKLGKKSDLHFFSSGRNGGRRKKRSNLKFAKL